MCLLNSDTKTILLFSTSLLVIIVSWAIVVHLRKKAPDGIAFYRAKRIALSVTALSLFIQPINQIRLVGEISPRTRCISNLKQLGLAMVMYQADSDEFYPITSRWETSIAHYTTRKTTCIFHGLETGYSFNANLPQNGILRHPESTLLLAEANRLGPNLLVHREEDIVARHGPAIIVRADTSTKTDDMKSVYLKDGDTNPIRFTTEIFDPNYLVPTIAKWIRDQALPYCIFGSLLAGVLYFLWARDGMSFERGELRYSVIFWTVVLFLAIMTKPLLF